MTSLLIAASLLAAAAFVGCGPSGAALQGSPAPTVTSPPKQTAAAVLDKEDIPPEAATGRQHVDLAHAGKRMVASANPHASRAGMAILRAGGSAVDAAVAMAAVLTLVEPQSSGIGGGAFMLHLDPKNGEVAAYDGRETAPASATEDMFLDPKRKPLPFFDAVIGGLSVGVPGELRMLEMAHREHGKLPWSALFDPAIALAEKGFAISPRLHGLLARDRYLPRMKVAGSYFYRADGKPKPVGTLLTNPALAQLLRRVAAEGADAFYGGDIADDMASTVVSAARAGRMTAADVASYRPKKRKGLCRPYRQYRICGMPPPTSGGVTTLQILGMLQRFELASLSAGSLEEVHLFAEASRLAYADRALYLADPDFIDVPTAALLDPVYLAQRSQHIDPSKSMGMAQPGTPATAKRANWARDASPELPSTSHLVVVDGAGHVVSMTASIEGAFGSHLMVHGFLLNNEMTDFSFVPQQDGVAVANRVQPGKRPRSSMAPIIVLDREGRFHMAVGSPGGSRIIEYVTRVLIATLDHGVDVQAAIAQPNVSNRNGVTEIERMPGANVRLRQVENGLRKLGHEVKVRDLNSGLHAIQRTDTGYAGAADPRREGVVLGD